MASGGVEARRRLVEEHQLRIADQRQRDIEAALLAAGELLRARVALPRSGRRARSSPPPPADAGSSRRRARRARAPSARRASCRTAAPGRRASATARSAAAGPRRARCTSPRVAGPVPLEDLDGRRLPGAVGTEEREHLAVPDLEVDPAHDLLVAVGLAQPADVDRESVRAMCGPHRRNRHREQYAAAILGLHRNRRPSSCRPDGVGSSGHVATVAPRSDAMPSAHERISSQSRRSLYCSGVFLTVARSIRPRGSAATLPPKTT